jgi:hypothetical protein
MRALNLRGLRAPLAFSGGLRGNYTASCHANLKKAKIVRFEGLELTHNDHVYKHNLACTFADNSGCTARSS